MMHAISYNEEYVNPEYFVEWMSHDDSDSGCETPNLSCDDFLTIMDSSNMDYKTDTQNDADSRISLAYERLTEVPQQLAEKFSNTVQTIDLSHNNIRDLSFLINFTQLNSLILDKNHSIDETTLPFLQSLRLLWINNCNIDNIARWLQRIKTCCPKIRYLSMMRNPGVTSCLNGRSDLEQIDYRIYVISQLPFLKFLDDMIITEDEREKTKSYNGIYTVSGVALNCIERIIFPTGRTRKRRRSDKAVISSDSN